MTILVGYWLCVVRNWLYIAKYGAKIDFITHVRYIKNKNSHSRGDGENWRLLSFFLQMIWFILIAFDLMIFLFQRIKKQNLRSLPLIVGNVLFLSFLYSPEVGFQMWKSGVSNVGLRIQILSNLIDAAEKIHQLWVSILFLTGSLDMVRFPCRQHSRWTGKARLIRFWCRKGHHTGTLMIIASLK